MVDNLRNLGRWVLSYVVFNIRAGVLDIISDKAQIASILNGLEMLYTPRKSKQNFCDNPHVFYQI